MVKKILFSIFSIFLIFQSIKLNGLTVAMDADFWGFNILLGVLVNIFVTGVFAFSGFVYPTQRLLPNAYYKVSNVSFQKKIYKLLRIDLFRKFLLVTFWRKSEMQKTHFDGTRKGIDNLILQSKKSEFGHLIPFIILLCLSLYWIGLGQWKVGIVTTIINLVFNLYPVFLQRQHRMRVQFIRERHRLIEE